MFLAHSIRLRDPWQCETLAGGGCRWSRRFHRPTGLEPDDQLLLVLSGLPADAVVKVNGHAFSGQHSAFSIQHSTNSPSPTAQQFDLTSILADANQIDIDLPSLLPPASSLQPPALAPQPHASCPFDARLAVIGHS